MNNFITTILVVILCSGCESKTDQPKLGQMTYVCSSLVRGYLKLSQFDSYEVWKKEDKSQKTIKFLYTKFYSGNQICLILDTKLLECTKERGKYFLSEIDQHSLKKSQVLTLALNK